MNKIILNRIDARIEELRVLQPEKRWSRRSVSLAATNGRNPDLVRMTSAKNYRLKADDLAAIERVIQVPPGYLLAELPTGGIDDANVTNLLGASGKNAPIMHVKGIRKRGVPIVGDVEAGAWRAVDLLDQRQPERTNVAHDVRFREEDQVAYRIHGDSMNLAKCTDGRLAVAVKYLAWCDIMGDPPDGSIVVIERSREGGSEIERSLKRIKYFPDRWEYWPDSDNPIHKPIVVPLNHDADPDEMVVSIVAVVVRATDEFI